MHQGGLHYNCSCHLNDPFVMELLSSDEGNLASFLCNCFMYFVNFVNLSDSRNVVYQSCAQSFEVSGCANITTVNSRQSSISFV